MPWYALTDPARMKINPYIPGKSELPLRTLTGIPEGLLRCEARQLHEFLGGPTLIHIEGALEPVIFVSVLLHGNETSGWDGVRRYLLEHHEIKRNTMIFIGSISIRVDVAGMAKPTRIRIGITVQTASTSAFS